MENSERYIYVGRAYVPSGFVLNTNCQLLISEAVDDNNAVNAYYNVQTNRLFIRNADDTLWVGDHAPGDAILMDATDYTLNIQNTTVNGTGTTVTIDWALTFKSGLSGKTLYIWMKAVDTHDVDSGWILLGTISVPA